MLWKKKIKFWKNYQRAILVKKLEICYVVIIVTQKFAVNVILLENELE
jgi:hypothetical protein